MNDAQQREAAKKFVENWIRREGSERSECHPFWFELLQKIFGVEEPAGYIIFEERVQLKHVSYIDGHIPSRKVMIEQKSRGVRLDEPIKQSDGTFLSPIEQIKRYIYQLPVSKHPEWVILCNFDEFWIYDMEYPQGEPEKIRLVDLPQKYDSLNCLVEKKKSEEEISVAAGELVGLLYNAFKAQYADPDDPEIQKSINMLCVRLVFCLYADDAEVFGRRGMFRRYLESYEVRQMRVALIGLFKILDQKPEERPEYLADDNPQLAEFPYVNGGLFNDENIKIPPFTEEIRRLLLSRPAGGWRWRDISPTIFGAAFESTLNPKSRRSGGMHYTSIENIHKVIDPLFLKALRAECDAIIAMPNPKKGVNPEKGKKVREFKEKLSKLTFFDPACGSGNFLTETYLSLRGLENDLIEDLFHGQLEIGEIEIYTKIEVQISQFYGIEINDFAVSVAKTALWIAESQMMQETERIIKMHLNFLPLETNANIHEGNALTTDWEKEIIPREKLNYIIGNPPFAGRRYRTPEQIEEVATFFKFKDIDYVACWYKKAAQFIQGTGVKCAFVSTNSITQGEQVAALWKELFENYNIEILFAYRTFKWESESKEKAAVYCVIIGFSVATGGETSSETNGETKYIFSAANQKETACNINGYLMDAPNIFITTKTRPIFNAPSMRNGNVPLDGDALKIEEEDYFKFDNCKHLVKRLIGGRELLHNEKRYVLWLVGVSPEEIKKYPQVYERVKLCKERRLAMKDAGTKKLADTPTIFRDTNNPEYYVALPMVSSENRKYIPIDYFDKNVIPTNQVQIIPDATLYHFGVLMSNVHMAWARAVCGRLEMRYRYSKDIVYNNFPWPEPTSEQREKIEKTAQAILEARAKFPNASLADLYDDLTMPPELRKAHKENDLAVMKAYGFSFRSKNEARIVTELMKLYAEKTAPEK